MSHKEQQDFVLSVKNKFPSFFNKKRVLEVGSWNVNGTVRDFFTNCDYVGIDLAEGKDVDVVCAGHVYKNEIPFDVAISCECFEHNKYWLETFVNMISHVNKDGLIVMTCATTGRLERGTSTCAPECSMSMGEFGDYYKNLTEEDFTNSLDMDFWFDNWKFEVCGTDLYFYGVVK